MRKLQGHPKGSMGRLKLPDRAQEIQMLLAKEDPKASIAKIADVSKTTLLHVARTRQHGEAS